MMKLIALISFLSSFYLVKFYLTIWLLGKIQENIIYVREKVERVVVGL